MPTPVGSASLPASAGRWSRLAWPAVFAAVGVALFAVYLTLSTRSTYVNSDGASNALQAWAMLHGNLLLRGWTVSDVSFYTTELPEYMLVESVRGLGPDVVHICGALTYTLLVLLAAALAKGRATGRAGAARALLAGGIMLAPQLGNATGLLLLSPDHVGTGVPLLVAWLLVDRGEEYSRRAAGWRRWVVPEAVGLLLAWTAVGDPLAEIIGALPLAVVCLLRVGAKLIIHWTERTERLAGYELSLAVAAVLSVPLAYLASRAITAAGGWTASSVRTALAGPGALQRNGSLAGNGILELFGADFLHQPTVTLTVFAFVHLIGLTLAAAAFCLAVCRFFPTVLRGGAGGSSPPEPAGELLVQVLTLAIVVNVAAYVFTVQAQNITNTREIAAVLPFGAVLAGRLIPRPGPAARHRPAGRPRLSLAVGAAVAGGAALAVYAGMLGYSTAQPPVQGQPTALAAWLSAHDLTRGLGGYWQSNCVTVDTGGQVQVRAIDVNAGVLMSGSYWEASDSWYDPATQYADFVVGTPPVFRPRDPGVLVQHMAALAGQPARIYFYDGYAIAVWRQNLLTDLR
jgi:hypothetical protein